MMDQYKPKAKKVSAADIMAVRVKKTAKPIPIVKPKPVGIDISTYRRSLW